MLFFLLSLFFALLAWNLYRPNFTHPRLSIFSFLAGWLVGELVPFVILAQAVLVALLVLAGAVSGLFGALGFLTCVGTWSVMAFYYYQSNRAEAEVARALSDGLSENYLDEIKPDSRENFPSAPDLGLLMKPFAQQDSQVEVIKDLSFGDFGGRLDIRRPRQLDDNGRMPVLLQIHGGAWTQNYGSKNEQGLPLMNHMAKRGWVCVATSYRLSPKATFPEHIIDCKQALVWTKAHIADYGGDPDFVVVTGGSAGGHLSTLMALTPNHPAFQPGFTEADTSLQGAVPFYGVYDFTNSRKLQHHNGLVGLLAASVMKLPLDNNEVLYRDASPLFHINEKAPPFLVIHGDLDTLVPVEEGRLFSEELCKISNNKVVYMELPGAQHAFDIFPSLRSEHVKHGVEKFLTWTHSQHLDATPSDEALS